MSVPRAVLDATLEIIRTQGPDLVSMREVARRAQVSHQAPYHHFGDRSGIFAAIAAEGFGLLAGRFQAVLAEGPGPARRCFDSYVRMALDHPAHFRVMFRSDLNGIVTHGVSAEAADMAFGELVKMVEQTLGIAHRDRTSFTWATLLWSAAHGLATLILDGPLLAKLPDGTTLDDLITDVVALLSDMVETQATAIGLSPSG